MKRMIYYKRIWYFIDVDYEDYDCIIDQRIADWLKL